MAPRYPPLLFGVLPRDVLATRIAALLPPADRHDGNGRNSAPPARPDASPPLTCSFRWPCQYLQAQPEPHVP